MAHCVHHHHSLIRTTSLFPLSTSKPNSGSKPRHLVCLVSQSEEQSKSRNRHVWVNPESRYGNELRRHSYDSRYTSLVQLSHTLDALPHPSSSSDLLSSILSAFPHPPLFEQDAVIVLNHLSNPSIALFLLSYFLDSLHLVRPVVLYNVTLKVLRKARDFDSALHLFDEMLHRGIIPDNVTFSTLISCARICNWPHRAVELFEKMPSYGCVPDNVTYSAMIDAYGRCGNVDMALALYDRARTERWRVDPVTFSTLIKIYGQSGNYDGCLNVYQEMKALGVKPNLVIYNTLLDAMGRAKRPWQAKNIYNDMTQLGISPTFATYAALLRAFCRARYGHDAINLYQEMKDKGMQLDVVLYNTLLAMCADVAYVDEAVQIYEDLKSSVHWKPDSWTFSSMVTIYSCSGRVGEAEKMVNDMVEAGFEPNIFVFTSLIQCYGKVNKTDDMVSTFNRVLEMGIVPDDRFCGCLLNVMTQTPKEEMSRLLECVHKANAKLGNILDMLLGGESSEEGQFKAAAFELFDTVSTDVKKPYLNCMIDLCVNHNLLEKACELLEMGLTSRIYKDVQSRTPTQWSLHLKSLSLGAALTSLHVWINDLNKAIENEDELPPLLGINTGHGKHKYSEKGLAGAFEAHLKELDAPFHEASGKTGWFLTTKAAAVSWLKSRKSTELVWG
ncbi:hypothetical protein RND81_07G115800 [Saponaria officinalis]|uniref:Smr domain-containing protein n=1 Tax=Saponaria officinalis TaxID=3572 RepID=A0AAW1JME6_SAPOF